MTKIQHKGYTLDQSVIVVAVIGILLTLVVTSFGTSILGRAKGAQIASYFKQIESANTTFRIRHGVWPHLATDGDSAKNAGVLVNSSFFENGRNTRKFRSLLPGFNVQNNALFHSIGSGGRILQDIISIDGHQFLVTTFENIPLADAQIADEMIDGHKNAARGRARYTIEESGRMTTFSYIANMVSK